MTEGKWYLVYDDYDSMENHHPHTTEKVPLDATDWATAVSKGTQKWQERLAKGTCLPDKWHKEPYPNKPRIIHEFPLSVNAPKPE